MAKVIVLGGGVAGLSAAHELVERGFEVEVYEKSALVGGKARSVTKVGSGMAVDVTFRASTGFAFFRVFISTSPTQCGGFPLEATSMGCSTIW